MPREAKRLDAVTTVASLADIPRVLTDTVRQYADVTARAVKNRDGTGFRAIERIEKEQTA
jgi:hypothetical protein